MGFASLAIREIEIKAQGDTNAYSPAWLRLKRLEIKSVGEDVDNWNSYIPGESVN